MKEQVQLLKIVYDFLNRLSEEELELLVTKKAKLCLEKGKEKKVTEHTTQVSIEEICKKIEGFEKREEAQEYINGLALHKNDLRAVAKQYNIPIGSKETNAQMIAKIIENVVGAKLRFDALLNTDLKR